MNKKPVDPNVFFEDEPEVVLWVIDPHSLCSESTELFPYPLYLNPSELNGWIERILNGSSYICFLHDGPAIDLGEFVLGHNSLVVIDTNEVSHSVVDAGVYVLTKDENVKLGVMHLHANGRHVLKLESNELKEVSKDDLRGMSWVGMEVIGRVRALISEV